MESFDISVLEKNFPYSSGKKYNPQFKDSTNVYIGSFLRGNGYYHFSIDSSNIAYNSDSSKVDINTYVTPGKQSLLNKINYKVKNPEDSLYIYTQLSFLLEKAFIRTASEEAFLSIVDYYEDNSFPFTKIIIKRIEFVEQEENYLANLYLNIEKNFRGTISKINITGNTKTKDYVIKREIRLGEDQPYSDEFLEDVPSKLNKLRFFEPVDKPSFYIDHEGVGTLDLTVKEKQTNSFDGIIGYVPATNDDEEGFFSGYVNVSLRNILGTGRAFGIEWNKQEKLSQDLELKYLEPWIFGLPFNINIGLNQLKEDTTYVQTKYNINLDYLASDVLTASFLLSSESTVPSGDDSTQFTVFNSSTLSTGFNLTLNTTDDFYSPTKGIIFSTTYTFSNKKINGPEQFITETTDTDIKFQTIEADLKLFYQIFTRQIIALGLHGKELKGSFFEISDLFRLGGTNSLRGYREKQFTGNRIFWSNLEYRYLLSKRSYAFLFYDTGYYLRSADEENNILESSAFKMGYGFGLNIESGLGVLAISYALGEGDTFNTGKIHFGLINEF